MKKYLIILWVATKSMCENLCKKGISLRTSAGRLLFFRLPNAVSDQTGVFKQVGNVQFVDAVGKQLARYFLAAAFPHYLGSFRLAADVFAAYFAAVP